MQPWWYWALFLAASVVLLVAVPVCSWLEAKDAERDRDLWDSLYGARR